MWKRKPAVAGSFYPARAEEIKELISTYLSDVQTPEINEKIYGCIVPHAGYIYSGPVAAYSYSVLQNAKPETVLILAPSHRARFNNASVIPEGIYETPMGEVTINSRLGLKLTDCEHISFIQEAHMYEHSLEVQVPFLQYVLNDFSLIPIIIGTTDISACESIAEEISKVIYNEKEKIAIVISTDLSHFYSYNHAISLDNRLIEALKTFDIETVHSVLQTGEAEACGHGPLITGLHLCKLLGADRIRALKYMNSGDTAGSKDQVVGYLSAVITGK